MRANSSSSFNSVQELPSCLFVAMADVREIHTTPGAGVAHNNDPALDIAHEHEHPHVHHSARAAHPDNIVYTTGTTDEKTSKLFQPSALDSHLHQRHSAGDVEKAGGYDYEVEKATRSSSDPDMEGEKRKKWYSPSSLYKKYRLLFHILIGAFFTG